MKTKRKKVNRYLVLKNRQQEEMNAFPIGAAFDNKQFKEMMQNWGLTAEDNDKILSIGAGCYIRKTDREAFRSMCTRFHKEMQDSIEADKTGKGFITDMFYCELANHEYCVTGDIEETLDSLHLTLDEVNKKQNLVLGLDNAIKLYEKNFSF